MKKILIPRKTGEERKKNHRFSIQKKIKKYIKEGSKRDLDLSNSPVEKIPDHLKVVGGLDGFLDLRNTQVEKLPDHLKVRGGLDGFLDLKNTQVEKLPDNLKVGGDLDLRNTPIEELPDNLKVLGSLNLNNTPLSKKYTEPKIRDLIEQKGGYVKRDIIT
jgi:hypothetical protein